jgi:hypothetical protein
LIVVCLGPVACATTTPERLREQAADSWSCAPSAIQITQTAPDEYEASGCAMRAVYECQTRRHIRAEGAPYEECRRVQQHPLP